MSNWIDKLKEMFFGGGVEEEATSPEHKEGTVPFATREIEGRVQHIYPEAGNFRFPVPIEPEVRARATSRPRSEPEVRNHQESNNSTKYFQGTLKRASETPSPIYGYRKVDSEITQPEKGNQVEVTTEPELGNQQIGISSQQQVGVGNYEFEVDQEVVLEEKGPGVEQLYEEQQVWEVNHPEEQQVEEEQHLEDKRVAEISVAQGKVIPLRPKVASTTSSINQVNSYQVSSNQVNSYQAPALSTLQLANYQDDEEEELWTRQQADLLMDTFQSFNLQAELIGVTKGPTVTRFEIQPAPGIKINKFTNLQDDLKLSLAAKEIRIEAPIPGKQAIGIEVPNLKAKPVLLGDILTSKSFQESSSPLTICLGADLSGQPVVTDIQKMPHGLIAGSTGSGKSVCINSILVSLLYKSTPQQLRLLLIDPKVVELSPYQNIPHLVTPVVTDPKKANAALKWAVEEMERRYQLFADAGVRDLERYNRALAVQTGEEFTLPYIVIIIDELADLMMVAPQDVEDSICRLTQKARACGIHLIVATQRPSVDVITGLIKANIPTRLAFFVSSQVDSRTILDMAGAERLLGRGDMLFLPNGAGKAFRVQGSYVSDEEIEKIVEQVSLPNSQNFLFSSDELTTMNELQVEDDLLAEAALFVLEQGVASASSLQRRFRIGYNRAARMIEWMEEQGMISESLGSKPRNVLWSEEQILEWLDSQPENG